MRRLAGIVLTAACVFAAVLMTGAASPSGAQDAHYRVRAIFDNASAAAEGEDVKIAGARVGSIESLSVTPDRKAAITIAIDDTRFVPFHLDGQCTLRPEGVLAVKFVECDPGTAASPALPRIGSGDGAGTHLMGVEQTSSPIDLDLLNNIMRQPTGQQFRLLLTEFGTGLAGRGADLNAVIHRANPALGETDRVLRVLAGQRRELQRFATNAEEALAPLARDRRFLADFIRQADRTGRATALHADDISLSIQRLPAFLGRLRTQMTQLEAFIGQAVPVLTSLDGSAPALSRATEQLRGFSTQARPALIDLGATAQRAQPLLDRTRPLIADLQTLGTTAQPVATNLAQLTSSFDQQLGTRHVMDTLYYGANAVNGFDAVGHYARGEPLSNSCSEYTGKGFFGCDAQWGATADAAKPITLPENRLLNYLLGP
jgi:ABC-type transporter Mla subunit MlaD